MTVSTLPAPPPDDDEPEQLVFDVNELTFGEVETIEEIVGRDVMRELGSGNPSVRTVVALIYVVKRRADPAFTLEDARAMRVNAIRFEGQANPKEPGG